MESKYTISSKFEMNVRSGHSVTTSVIGEMSNGETGYGNEIFVIEQDGDFCRKGDKWLHVFQIGNRPLDGWVAIIHMGIPFCTLVDTSVSQRQYYRLRYDWEKESQYKGKLRGGWPCPGILNFQQLQHNKFGKDWQEFWFSLNRTDNKDKDIQAWCTYTNSKAFLTDHAGTDYNRNYITGENLDKDLPKIETKGCIGNVVCIDETNTIKWKGLKCVKIITLDITKPPPFGMTYKTHPHLIHHATNLAGVNKVNPFTHLGGRNTGIPIYFPLTAKGNVYYPLLYLQKLPIGSELPNPYVPPMKF